MHAPLGDPTDILSDVVRPSFEANDLKSWEGARGVHGTTDILHTTGHMLLMPGWRLRCLTLSDPRPHSISKRIVGGCARRTRAAPRSSSLRFPGLRAIKTENMPDIAALTDDIRLPFLERSVSFEPRAGRVSPRQLRPISTFNKISLKIGAAAGQTTPGN